MRENVVPHRSMFVEHLNLIIHSMIYADIKQSLNFKIDWVNTLTRPGVHGSQNKYTIRSDPTPKKIGPDESDKKLKTILCNLHKRKLFSTKKFLSFWLRVRLDLVFIQRVLIIRVHLRPSFLSIAFFTWTYAHFRFHIFSLFSPFLFSSLFSTIFIFLCKFVKPQKTKIM